MSKETEYKENAARFVELAQHTTSTADKGHRIRLAEAWLDLIDSHRAARSHRPKEREHPLVRAAFDRYQPNG